MQNTFAHIVSYITGGAAGLLLTVSQLSPAAVAAIGGPHAAMLAAAAIPAAGALLNLFHAMGWLPNSTPQAGTVSLHLGTVLIAGLLAAGILGGCTTLGNFATPAANPLVQVAADVAVAQAVGTGADAHARAQKIASIANAALAIDTGNSTTLVAVESAVTAQIAKLSLPPADALAAQVLVQTLGGIVTQQLTAGGGAVTTPAGTAKTSTTVAIALVLNDVIAATAVY